jgi:two-component system CheB/CheR fusion protein
MQVDQTLDRSKGGLGLGLALVKGLVEMHGGSIEARSDGLGKGTAFVVRLPLDGESAAETPTARTPGPRVGRRVLIIEDNLDAAESLREALILGEHEVEVAHSGPDGIEKARSFRPEIVLCDIGLPGMDGYDVARIVRHDPVLRSTFLVALSGYALPEDIEKAAQAGFQHHLAKPPSVDALERILAELPNSPDARPLE